MWPVFIRCTSSVGTNRTQVYPSRVENTEPCSIWTTWVFDVCTQHLPVKRLKPPSWPQRWRHTEAAQTSWKCCLVFLRLNKKDCVCQYFVVLLLEAATCAWSTSTPDQFKMYWVSCSCGDTWWTPWWQQGLNPHKKKKEKGKLALFLNSLSSSRDFWNENSIHIHKK